MEYDYKKEKSRYIKKQRFAKIGMSAFSIILLMTEVWTKV